MSIISASRRTDVPAFFSEWFMRRIREGFLYVRSPYNANRHSRVGLSAEEVDAIVFWTRDPRPMMKHLDELDKRGYRYYFHFTLTGYPRAIEPSAPFTEEAVESFRALSGKVGAGRVIWRYDPIIISDVTPEDFIARNFEILAGRLRGRTERVVISFAEFYRKVIANLKRLETEQGIRFTDISGDDERVNEISSRLSEIAWRNSMEVFSCAEEHDLSTCGIRRGKCIDDELIEALFGLSPDRRKDRSQRKHCGCVTSRDIGRYDTCTHGCVYCYANSSMALSSRNAEMHDPESPFLA
jgi:DNA repair photolyase